MLAPRLVGSLAVWVKLLLYGIDQLLNPQRAVVDDVDRIVPDIRRKLQRSGLTSALGCMRRNMASESCELIPFPQGTCSFPPP